MIVPRSQGTKNICPVVLMAAVSVVLCGCATTRVPSDLSVRPLRDRGQTISVGEFSKKMGFAGPNQIRFNVALDTPVSEFVRRMVISELERDGYTIGSSPYEVSGGVNSVVFDQGTSISFTLKQTSRNQLLYEKTFKKDGGVSFIYDSEGQVEQVRLCVRDFVADLSPKLVELAKPASVSPAHVTKPATTTTFRRRPEGRA